MTVDIEISWPTMLATFLTGTRLWTFCACNNSEIVHCALKILRSGMQIVPSSAFKVQPKNSRHWTGSQTHFSAFGTKPDLSKLDLISHPNSKANWKLGAQPKPSSRYIRTSLPSPLHLATKGRVYISLWIDCLFEIRKIAVCFLWLSLPGHYRVTDEALLAETT